MEEIAPASVSVSNILAPEEIFNKKKKELKNPTEKSQDERKAERRQKKSHKKKQKEQKEADEKQLERLGKRKMSKEQALKKIQKDHKTKIVTGGSGDAPTTSSALFKKLQEEVQSKIKGDKPVKKKQRIESNASKLKL